MNGLFFLLCFNMNSSDKLTRKLRDIRKEEERRRAEAEAKAKEEEEQKWSISGVSILSIEDGFTVIQVASEDRFEGYDIRYIDIESRLAMLSQRNKVCPSPTDVHFSSNSVVAFFQRMFMKK